MKFFKTLKGYFTNKEIIQRFLFTLLILFIFRVLSKIPAPGIEADALESLFGNYNSGTGALFNMANVLAGGTLSQFSIISVGLFAFISASVIFQLLGPIVPKVEQLNQMGETGRKVINQWTRILTVPLSAIQAYGIYLLLTSQTNAAGFPLVESLSNYRIATLLIVLVAGTMLLIWLAELCSEKGLGGKNGGGISIIITAGIISSIPTSLVQSFSNFASSDYLRNFWFAFGIEWVIFLIFALIVYIYFLFGKKVVRTTNQKIKILFTVLYTISILIIPISIVLLNTLDNDIAREFRTLLNTNLARLENVEIRFGFYLALTFQIIGITTFFNESVRRIPVKFITRIRNSAHSKSDENSYLPIKFLAAGVMPVIFSTSFLLMPAVIERFFGDKITKWNNPFGTMLDYAVYGWLDQYTSPYYHVLHFILTVLFSMFFITIVMKPEDIAKSLKSRKTYIPNVRPGNETIEFLSKTILRTTFWGGLILATISVMPFVLGLYSTETPLGIESFLAGGTSVLIVVPTILAIKAQLDAMVLTKNYDKFEDL